jgi:hypothetical protein
LGQIKAALDINSIIHGKVACSLLVISRRLYIKQINLWIEPACLLHKLRLITGQLITVIGLAVNYFPERMGIILKNSLSLRRFF